jgi:hypothetical protein
MPLNIVTSTAIQARTTNTGTIQTQVDKVEL